MSTASTVPVGKDSEHQVLRGQRDCRDKVKLLYVPKAENTRRSQDSLASRGKLLTLTTLVGLAASIGSGKVKVMVAAVDNAVLTSKRRGVRLSKGDEGSS